MMDVNSLLGNEYGVVAVPFLVYEAPSTVLAGPATQEDVQWLPDNNSVLLTFSTINSLPLEKNDAEGMQHFGPNTIIGGPLDDSPGTFTLLEPTDSPQTVTLLDPNGNADSPQTTIIDIADPSALAGLESIFEPTSQDNSPLPMLTEEVASTEESIVDDRKTAVLNGSLEDVAEVVTVVKCKLCDFHCQTTEQVAEHLAEEHSDRPQTLKPRLLRIKNQKSGPKKSQNEGKRAQLDSAEEKTSDKVDEEDEERMANVFFSCGSCLKVCTSMGELRKHMHEIHSIKKDQPMDDYSSQNVYDGDDDPSTVDDPAVSPGGSAVNVELEYRRRLSLSSDGEIVAIETVAVDDKNAQELKVKTHVEPEINLDKPAVGQQKELKFQCRQCKAKFSSMANVEKHMKCHSEEGSASKFQCSVCEQPFNRWLYCSNHLWLTHKIAIDLYSCPLCDYKIALRDRYMIHEKRHRQHKEFSCQYCSKRFSQKTQLRNHEVLHLKKACSSALPGWAKRKECELCGKSFWDSKALKKHIKTVHSKLKPYVCQVCGHCSARKGMFQLHIRQHTGDKPHACSVCDFATRDHNTLRRHMMRHTGVRQYQCKFCSYSAIQAFMFKSHLIKHHDGEGVFRCTKCPYSTLNEQAFHYHKHDDAPKVDESKDNKPTFIYVPFNEKDGTNKSGSGELIAVNLPEDDESINYFDHTIDTGGITIAEDIKTTNPQEEVGCLAIENGQGHQNGSSKMSESQVLTTDKSDKTLVTGDTALEDELGLTEKWIPILESSLFFEV